MRGRKQGLAAFIAASLTMGVALSAQAELVGLWRFEEGSGTVAADSSGNGLDGTLVGETWDGSDYVDDPSEVPTWTTGPGGSGSALSFDSDFGVSPFAKQSVQVPFDASMNMTGEMTFSAWVYYDSNSTSDFLPSVYPTMLFRFDSYFFQARNQGDSNFYAWDALAGGFQNGLAAPDAAVDTWQHVAYVMSGGQMSLYIDGALQDTVATTDPTSNSADLIIGMNDFQSADMWFGALDDVALFDTALTETEIDDIIATGDYSGFVSNPNAIPTVPAGAPVGGVAALGLLGVALAGISIRAARRRN